MVVEDREDYIRDGLAHLSNRNIYTVLAEDPTQELCKAINGLVRSIHSKGHISNDMRDFLHLDATKTRTQQAYFLKKLHKGPREVRPIVSGVSGPTENLSAFMDYYLQPLVAAIPSYLKDSAHLIRILELEKPATECTWMSEPSIPAFPRRRVSSAQSRLYSTQTLTAMTYRSHKRRPVTFSAPFWAKTSLNLMAKSTSKSVGQPWAPKWPRHSPTCSWLT